MADANLAIRPETFEAGEVTLTSGVRLPDTKLVYCTFGSLNARGDNAVIMPTHFGGTHEHSLYLIGPGRALDPDTRFIVVVNLLGNGVSTSPSHGLGADFPLVSVADNVNLQHRLLREHLGVNRLALAVGHSMGAMQTFHWAALYPDFVERAAPFCGAARVSRHNAVFLDGMRGILEGHPDWDGGRYKGHPTLALRTMARAWAAWPPSSHFYRNGFYEGLGYDSVADFVERYWEATYAAMDMNNVLAQIATWKSGDIANDPRYGGDFEKALSAIKARTFVMPSETDAYFPPEDSAIEVRHMNNAELRPIPSQWGHWAGSGRNPADTEFIDAQLRELLAS